MLCFPTKCECTHTLAWASCCPGVLWISLRSHKHRVHHQQEDAGRMFSRGFDGLVIWQPHCVLLGPFSAHESILRKSFWGEHISTWLLQHKQPMDVFPKREALVYIYNSTPASEFILTLSHHRFHLCEWPSVLAKAVYKGCLMRVHGLMHGPLHLGQRCTKMHSEHQMKTYSKRGQCETRLQQKQREDKEEEKSLGNTHHCLKVKNSHM